MPTPRRSAPRSLPDSTRRKLDVTTAMAWENLVDSHVAEATAFILRLEEFNPVEDSLTRYLREMDLTETMGTAVRTRVLLGLEELDGADDDNGQQHGTNDGGSQGEAPVEEAVWRRFRPSAMVREVKERQRKGEEIDRLTMLLLARAEDHVMATHVENAIGFAALLDGVTPLDRAVQHYLGSVNLSGCRGQVVFQRTMARLADVHLGPPEAHSPA
ncbi:MAG: hypothetical protein ABIV28_05600 [Longimicrobiales bacterium]